MSTTFSNDNDLPSLPLPDLDSTLNLYLDSVKALADENEDTFDKTAEIVKDIEIQPLHQELVRRSQEKKNWVRISYLSKCQVGTNYVVFQEVSVYQNKYIQYKEINVLST